MPATLQHLLLFLFPLLVTLGAFSDALIMKVPNRLSLALAGSFFALVPIAGLDWVTIVVHCTAGLTVLAAMFVMFAVGSIGGGDAKFAAAIALWLGWSHMAAFVLAAVIFAGVLALAVLAVRRTVGPALVDRQPTQLPWIDDPNFGMPAGVALAAAALLVYPQSAWMGLATG